MLEIQEIQEILVLVANDRDAVICSNCNGVTHLIRRCHKQGGPCKCEPGLLGQDVGNRRKFARELMAMLEHDAEDHAYEAVIVLADASIYDDLRRIRDCRLPRLLIADPTTPPIRCGECSEPPLRPGN